MAGPISADANGNVYYNAIKLDGPGGPPPARRPATSDSWLVKVSSAGAVTMVSYQTLMAPANPPTSCVTAFSNNQLCDSTGVPAGPFYITQVSPNLVPECKFKSTEVRDCHRNPDGMVTCVDDGLHPNGFEWCINAPAIDGNGNVYVESEDGFIYVLDQGHSGVFTTPKFKLFTNLAVGAAYTPFSIDHLGRLYAQNNGHLFVVGEGGGDVAQGDESHGPRTFAHDPDAD